MSAAGQRPPSDAVASAPSAYAPVADAVTRHNRVIWLGEQECFSWGVTTWAAVAAAVLVGWPVRVLTRNRVARSS